MPHRRLFLGAAGLVVVTWLLLVFGSTVRAHGAGLACPDWPLCFGEVVPPLDFGVFLEFGHRVLAGSVSVGFLALAYGILRVPALRGRMMGLVLGAALLLAAQVILGGLTVLELLAEWTVASHLVAGNAFCATLLAITLALGPRRVAAAPLRAGTRAAALALALLVGTQLAVGGMVASSFAGLACGPVFPLCAGPTLAPTWSGVIGLHLLHRLLGVLLLVASVLFMAYTWRRGPTSVAARWLAAAVFLQGCVGVANVLLRMPVELTLVHSAAAALVVLLAAWTVLCTWNAVEDPLARPRVGRAVPQRGAR